MIILKCGCLFESTPKSVLNHKGHKVITKFTKKINCFTVLCVLREFPLCTLW